MRGLPVFAFMAAFALVFVMIVDPYPDASPTAVAGPTPLIPQSADLTGDYEVSFKRDGYGVKLAPPKLSASAPAAGTPNPGSAKAIARQMLSDRGLGDDQYNCLVALWQRESGWNVYASNRSSGAYGIPQALPGGKMATAGSDWRTSAGTQIKWGLGYIENRYGSPCGAWNYSKAHGWY